ncbi:MAG: UDP-glucose 4-epimerase GalE [Actinobacteria bacterium]|nr:UDP-glucose 4-epimerase GalE [Actinomycetota bacterium]
MILIVGGAGYIGSHVNKLLVKEGHKTVIFDNLSQGYKEFVRWGEFVLGDLANKEQIRHCFHKYSINAVMHFSAFAYVGESVIDPAKYYLNNVAYTLNLLEVMREFGVNYFIFSSTCATYGIPKEIPIAEKHFQKPINPYGRSKLMIEEILRDYDKAYGIKHINLRYFNAAGADLDGKIGEWHNPETHLIPLVIYAALHKNDGIRLFGTDYPTKDGTCMRDYIHVNDLADAHIKALNYLISTNKSDSFNLGNGTGYSVREIIEVVRKINGKEFNVIESGKREGDPPILIASNNKSMDILSWRPQYADIKTIIETAWRWHTR